MAKGLGSVAAKAKETAAARKKKKAAGISEAAEAFIDDAPYSEEPTQEKKPTRRRKKVKVEQKRLNVNLDVDDYDKLKIIMAARHTTFKKEIHKWAKGQIYSHKQYLPDNIKKRRSGKNTSEN